MGKGETEQSEGWTRKFRYEDERTSKYWEISLAASSVTTAWGRTGRPAQHRTKEFPTRSAAESFAMKTIGEKTRKGYEETELARLVQISSSAKAIAEKLRFVGTEGGPLVVLAHELLPSWNGVFNAAGDYVFETAPCDYSRACEWQGQWVSSIHVGRGTGLVLHSNAAAAWLPADSGGLIVRWAAADRAAPLAHAALSVAKGAWRRTRMRLEVGPSRRLIMFDASRRGSELLTMRADELEEGGTRRGLRFRLPTGKVAVDQVDSIQGVLLDGTQPTEFSTELTRLRPVS